MHTRQGFIRIARQFVGRRRAPYKEIYLLFSDRKYDMLPVGKLKAGANETEDGCSAGYFGIDGP